MFLSENVAVSARGTGQEQIMNSTIVRPVPRT